MKQEFVELIKYRLEKAKKTLMDAQRYFPDASFESTVNRIYYAMFYAVNALLIATGLSSAKHSGIRAFFNREVVNKGLVEKELGKFYSDMFDQRQKGDYRDFVRFEKEDVEIWLKKAKDFIDKIEDLLRIIIEKDKPVDS